MRFIQTLRLTDFRNYDRLDLTLSGAPVVLYGPNGSGKTNLLEALSFLSPGRGLRRSKKEDIARRSDGQSAPAWGVTAEAHLPDDDKKLAIGQVPEQPGRKVVRIDDRQGTATELAGLLTFMWLTPAQDGLFTGPASDRRKFLDRFTLAHAPQHGQNVVRYEKARSQRNRLLSEGVMDESWFDALEADMARYGAQIAIARSQTVRALIEEIEQRAASAFPRAVLALDGEMEELAQSGLDLSDIQDRFSALLTQNRRRDRQAGRTLRGVHRTDLAVTYADKNMPAADCSTGEQKALLMGLFLAQARAQSERSPILLLDEMAAHLDENRRKALVDELLELNCQVFMTGTDASLFKAFDGATEVYEVSAGQLTRQ